MSRARLKILVLLAGLLALLLGSGPVLARFLYWDELAVPAHPPPR